MGLSLSKGGFWAFGLYFDVNAMIVFLYSGASKGDGSIFWSLSNRRQGDEWMNCFVQIFHLVLWDGLRD